MATVQFLADHGCTHAGTGAAFFAMYLAEQHRRGERLFPALKACPAGGAPTPAAVRRRVADDLGAPVISAWG